MTPFHERLSGVRKKSGKKQWEAADACGVILRTYQGYEGGKSEPNITRLIALADFFDVSLDYLLGRTDTDPNL